MSDEVSNETGLDLELSKYIENGALPTSKSHNELLMSIIPKINSSLNIIFPWIRSSTVKDKFIECLKVEIENNKKINIDFGYNKTNYGLSMIEDIINKNNFGKGVDKDISAVKALKKFLKENLKYIPPIHFKILLLDDRVLFVGSHNWLSNSGNGVNSKDEISCIIYDKSIIDYINTRYHLK